MNEDEAFIRAIVDAPGDDTPRLVYADWLDDRADPRGPYLWAERAAAETGDTVQLRELAVGLGPVWVARVSRPPVGVCCAHVRVEERGPLVDPAEIDSVEQRLAGIQASAREQIRTSLADAIAPELAERLVTCQQCRFPDQFRAFLLNYNGGRLTPGHIPGVRSSRGRSIAVWLDRFLSIVSVPPLPHTGTTFALDVIAADKWHPDQEDIWEHALRRLNIAFTDGYEGGIWIVLEGEEAGRIEFTGHDQDFDQTSVLAPSLAEFLSLLTDGTVRT